MEQKKKKKIAWIVSIISLVLIIATASILFAVLKNKKNSPSGNNASQMTSQSPADILLEAEKAMIAGKVSQNYKGNYVFSHVSQVYFNPQYTPYQIEDFVFDKYGVFDKNGLIHEMTNIELEKIKGKNEVVVLRTGKRNDGTRVGIYTKSHNKTQVVESGEYFGNDNLSEITTTDGKKYQMSLTSQSNTFTESTPTIGTNSSKAKLYLFKNFYNEHGNNLLFTITLVYNLIEQKPEFDFDFDVNQ